MERWIKKQHFSNFPVDFEELELILGELLDEVLEMDEINIEKPIELTFSLKVDKDAGVRIESIGNKFAARFAEQPLKNESLSSWVEQNDTFVFTADIAAFGKNNFELKIEETKLLICIKETGLVKKAFFLSPQVEPKILGHTFKNGILEVVFKKKI